MTKANQCAKRYLALIGGQNTPTATCNIPIEYKYKIPKSVDPTTYSYRLARALMEISINVTLSNCNGDRYTLPPPREFNYSQKLVGADPMGGIERMFGYIFYNKCSKQAIFAFTGTFFNSEWLDDLDVAQVPPTKLHNYKPGQLVHRGFYNIYETIQDQLRNFYRLHKIKQLYITGHSLGGILSILASFDFASIQRKATLLNYSFAAPRGGNPLFTQTFNKLVPTAIRVANTEDPIPTTPPPYNNGVYYNQVNRLVSFTKNLGPNTHVISYLCFLPKYYPLII